KNYTNTVVKLVDGDYANSTGGYRWNGGQSNRKVDLDFGAYPKKITAATWARSTDGYDEGEWKIQASNDGTTYVDITLPVSILDSRVTEFVSTGLNDGYYRYYRFQQVSGTTKITAYQLEVLFKTSGENGEDAITLSPSYDNIRGLYDRRTLIEL